MANADLLISTEIQNLINRVIQEDPNFWTEENLQVLIRAASLLYPSNVSNIIKKHTALYNAVLVNDSIIYDSVRTDLIAQFYPTHWPQIQNVLDYDDERSLYKIGTSPSSECMYSDFVSAYDCLRERSIANNNASLLSAMFEKYEAEVDALWIMFCAMFIRDNVTSARNQISIMMSVDIASQNLPV